jgi:hypothetical protein
MTCEGSRGDYIAVVEDVVAAARATSAEASAYLALVRSGAAPRDCGHHGWRRIAEMTRRLVDEEQRLFNHYERDGRHHPDVEAGRRSQPGRRHGIVARGGWSRATRAC